VAPLHDAARRDEVSIEMSLIDFPVIIILKKWVLKEGLVSC